MTYDFLEEIAKFEGAGLLRSYTYKLNLQTDEQVKKIERNLLANKTPNIFYMDFSLTEINVIFVSVVCATKAESEHILSEFLDRTLGVKEMKHDNSKI